MMKLSNLWIHCTATPAGRKVTKDDILRWHTAPQPTGRGWRKAGYTDLILLDGTIQNITPFDQDDNVDAWEITNGIRGHNSFSRHIAYAGGTDHRAKPMDTRTDGQIDTMEAYCIMMIARYPSIKIGGHNQVSSKACPSFDVPDWLDEIGIPEKNIYSK